MSIKNLGLSLWKPITAKPSPSPPRRASQSETTQVGFGLPSPEDPDPFGVRALELAGLEIKEAGSSIRPSIDAFEYRPSPTSPVFRLSTQSIDFVTTGESRRNSRRNSKRNSKRSLLSLRSDSPTSDVRDAAPASRNSISESRCSISERRSSLPTETPPPLPPRGHSPTSSAPSPSIATFAIDAGVVQSPICTEETVSRSLSIKSTQIQLPETINETAEDESEDEFDNLDDLDDGEDIIIEEVSTAAAPSVPTVLASPVAAKAKVVSIVRRGPPALPLKSPLRPRFLESPGEDAIPENQDEISSISSSSPDKSAFDKSEPSPNPWSEQTSLQDNDSIRQKDIGRDSLSISDPDDARKDPLLEDLNGDTKDTTPIAATSNFVLPSSANAGTGSFAKAEHTGTKSLATPITNSVVTSETAPVPEHKSSFSGSTLASMTNDNNFVESHPGQSLANLIKHGLSSGLADEDDYGDSKTDHYLDSDEVVSDYEDDVPIPSQSFTELTYSTPGAFVP